MFKNKMVVIVLVLVMALAGTTTAFADIDYSQWDSQSAYPKDVVNTPLFTPVKELVDKGIVTGDDDGLFHPDRTITRAEFATMMAKATRKTNNLETLKTKVIFTDLEGYGWAQGYINACYEAGLVKGKGGSNFAPADQVSYVEVIAMITRSKSDKGSMAESLGTWPNNYIRYAQLYYKMGDVIINDWEAAATRGDVAKLIYRLM